MIAKVILIHACVAFVAAVLFAFYESKRLAAGRAIPTRSRRTYEIVTKIVEWGEPCVILTLIGLMVYYKFQIFMGPFVFIYKNYSGWYAYTAGCWEQLHSAIRDFIAPLPDLEGSSVLVESSQSHVDALMSTRMVHSDVSALFYFGLIAAMVSAALAVLPNVLAIARAGFEKNSAYECGFEPFSAKREVFESHFLVVAILFLLFDLELIFLFPLSIYGVSGGFLGVAVVLVFLSILLVGFVFEWVRGALLWPTFFAKRNSKDTQSKDTDKLK